LFTEPLPSIERKNIINGAVALHRDTETHRLLGFMKYAVEMGSLATKIGSGIRNLIKEIHRHRDSMEIA
jgi:hypothetical protein